MIPAEAVEAAAKAMVRISRWEDVAGSSKMQLMLNARLALEAAAPHMLSHEREETRLAHLDAVVNAATVSKYEAALDAARVRADRWDQVAGAREQDNLVERDPEIWLENRTRAITLRANAHNLRSAITEALK